MAAQPPRIPPNNLLFCGPPPTLPHVVLLPSDAPDVGSFYSPSETCTQTNEDALHEINNVGVPIYGGPFDGQVERNVLKIDKSDNDLPPENCLRRTHSFDISDIYTSHLDGTIDFCALRHRRSEPDLSKYGLFLDAEVTVDCVPLEQPQIVLNNPFYNGSYAIEATQLDPAMVMLPENYLAFEDAFVPGWHYKPDYINGDFNSGLYYDGLPLIPSNDPWSAYGNDNIGFQYYSPQYEAPIGDLDGVHYMPLTDLDYAIPTYMSLPVVEEARIENTDAINAIPNTTVTNVYNNVDCSEVTNINSKIQPELPAVLESNLVNENEKASVTEAANKESSVQSDESVNADISNDVTSSLAFIPSSKSSQIPEGGDDDTNGDTSTCSTDYHEASALDLVPSLDECSCCDSTDFSQSRDEISPIPAVVPNVKAEIVSEVEKNTTDVVPKSSSNVSLSELPSIPIPDYSLSISHEADCVLANQKLKTGVKNEDVQPTCPQTQTNNDHVTNVPVNYVKEATVIKTPHNVPLPPAVPSSWLTAKHSITGKPLELPKICIQSVENTKVTSELSSALPVPPSAVVNQNAVEPQPSCSFAPVPPPPLPQPQPVQALLKSEKQTKEVEVS